MKSKSTNPIRKYIAYAIFGLLAIGGAVYGSLYKADPNGSAPVMAAFADSEFIPSADQMTTMYVVADLANTLSVPSSDTINENYISYELKREISGSSDNKIEKPNIIDTSSLARGIQEYIVLEDDTLASIAEKFGVTETQIRWSNNMKTAEVSSGKILYIPTIPGILYTVKEGDTLEALADKYKSNSEQITIYNDLELTGLTVGSTIILPSGELPEKERPEYVAPRPVTPSRPPQSTTSSYTPGVSTNSSGVRINVRSVSISRADPGVTGNKNAWGNCTWFAWWWRRHFMGEDYWLPSRSLGNARDWVRTLGGEFYVDKTPRYGAVVQTSTSGAYGHVGVVTAVYDDGSITMQEMNARFGGLGGYNRVIESEVPAEHARNYNYIHQRK
jgi:surface antigen